MVHFFYRNITEKMTKNLYETFTFPRVAVIHAYVRKKNVRVSVGVIFCYYLLFRFVNKLHVVHMR